MKSPETPSHRAERLKAIEADGRVRQLFTNTITDKQLCFLVEYIIDSRRDPTNIELKIVAYTFTTAYNIAVSDMRNRMDLMPYI